MDFKVVLISTYEMGRQPFGLASPAAWLRQTGASVQCFDLSVEALNAETIQQANLIAIHLPMHMATRMAVPIIEQTRRLNPTGHICCYGLYAPVNATYLHGLGVDSLFGGEFETGLVDLVRQLTTSKGEPVPQVSPSDRLISLDRQDFLVPDRRNLPSLAGYAQLITGEGVAQTVGYTEASRGCKHLCRHCPIVPVYNGHFRIVQREVVLADIRQQVAAGASHITFGDPDFFNGPGHAIPLIEALHQEFPDLTYDVTIKVEHLLKHLKHLETLKRTGCRFITSAVESFDEEILLKFDKHHTVTDFETVLTRCRQVGVQLIPTFVAFTPWTTLEGYQAFLTTIAQLGLINHVAPIQYSLRLLIPPGSRLLDLPEVQRLIGPLDQAKLSYQWSNLDRRVDQLQQDVERIVYRGSHQQQPRRDIFQEVWQRVCDTLDQSTIAIPTPLWPTPTQFVPYLTEPWYC